MSEAKHKPAVLHGGEGRKLQIMGQTVTVKLGSAETGGDYYLFENAVPPGVRIPNHIHSREDEILQVMEGELEVHLDGKTFMASAGAICYFPQHIVHGFGNVGTAPALGRFVVSPGANFEAFFEELGALPADQPPDLAKVAGIFDRYGLPIVQ